MRRCNPKQERPGGMRFNRDVELLRHRCSTLVDCADDQWAWENHHDEPVPADIVAAMPESSAHDK